MQANPWVIVISIYHNSLVLRNHPLNFIIANLIIFYRSNLFCRFALNHNYPILKFLLHIFNSFS